MVRKSRIHYSGAFCHVMLRGNAKKTIFHDKEDFRRFEDILSQGLEKFNLRLCAYCWMKNHVHMALQVSDIPRYIHLNPVLAEFVTDPLDYPGSSYRAYLEPDKASLWLSVDSALKMFGQTKEAAQTRYLHFMGQPVEAEHLELL